MPTVHGVAAAGVAMHCPNQGWPAVEIMVGVHVELGVQGALLPTVHGITGAGWGSARARSGKAKSKSKTIFVLIEMTLVRRVSL